MSKQKPNTVEEFFQVLPDKLDPDAAEGLDAVYQFDLSGDQGGQYYVLIHEGSCRVTRGSHADPHVTLSLSGEDCIRVLNGQLKGTAVSHVRPVAYQRGYGIGVTARVVVSGLAAIVKREASEARRVNERDVREA